MADRSWKEGLKAAGRSLSSSGSEMTDEARSASASSVHAVQYRKGGRVRKTGLAVLHKNERVIPASKRKKVERLMKRSKMRMKASGR